MAMTDEFGYRNAGAIGAATAWIQGTLLGSVATTVALIAIATVGSMMLTGRIDFRRAAQVVIGCFIIFGASTIAAGMQMALFGSSDADKVEFVPVAPQALPAIPPTKAVPENPDPFPGAALPPSP